MNKYLIGAGLKAKACFSKFFKNERGDVNVVAIVVLIAVAVVLALLLKDELGKLIKSMVSNITGKANEALTDI